jgi:hypothetical protein
VLRTGSHSLCLALAAFHTLVVLAADQLHIGCVTLGLQIQRLSAADIVVRAPLCAVGGFT